MLKLIFANNAEIEIKDGSTLFDIQVEIEKYVAMWEILTENNLKLVKLVSKNEDLVDQKENLVVDSENSFVEKGVVKCHFYLREKTENEILKERIEFLESQLNMMIVKQIDSSND